MKVLGLFLGLLVAALLPVSAQVTIEVTQDQDQFLPGETMTTAVRSADAVIHLAGEPVAQRWNEGAKRRIRESRVVGTRNLVQGLAQLRTTPQTLVCASAVGYYGSRGD